MSDVSRPAAFVAPMSHLDLTFMGSMEECLSRGGKVFHAVLDLLEREPEFRFFLEYVLFLDAYRTAHPQAAARLDDYIRQGRVELGAEWSGIFVTQEYEEDLIRNVLYAKRYARERCGIELETLQLSDIPGAIPQLPQVCAGLGIRNLVVTRCAPSDTLFWFAAPNGDRVLTWSSDQYNAAGRYGMHLGPAAMRERGVAARLREHAGKAAPLFYYGSDLFLPPPDLGPALRAWTADTGQHIAVTTPTGYFRALREQQEVLDALPVLSGELPSTWLYVEPDHPHVSRWDAIAERALDAAERLSTLAWLRLRRPYPKAELETLWKAQLLARDHNYGGKGAGEGQPRKLAERREVYTRARRLATRAMTAIAEQVEAPRESVPLVAFNTLNWAREGLVRAHVTYYPGVDPSARDILPRGQAFILRDPNSVVVPYQVTQDRRSTLGEFDLAFLAHDVPGLGYAAYTLGPASPEEAAAAGAAALQDAPHRADQQWFGATPPDVTLENGLVRLTVDRTTGQARLFDLRGSGDAAIPTGGTGTAAPMPGMPSSPRGSTSTGSQRPRLVLHGLGLQGRHELPEVMHAPPRALSYDDPPRETTEAPQLIGDEPVTVIEQGAVLTTVAVRQRVLGAPAEMRYTLYRQVPWLDVEVRLDWDVRAFGRVELICGVPRGAAGVHYGLPFGAGRFDPESLMPGARPVRADEATPESWRQTREISRWLSVDDPDGGVLMATDHRWTRVDPGGTGTDGAGDVLVRCCLVRGGRLRPASPETDGDDQSVRLVYRFRFVPHGGDWRRARAPQLGWEAVQPLLSYTVNDTWTDKSLPRRAALASVATVAGGAGSVLLTCLKQSEDGEAPVARWFEAHGVPCNVMVDLPGNPSLTVTDLLERESSSGESIAAGAAEGAVATRAWQIVTVRGALR